MIAAAARPRMMVFMSVSLPSPLSEPWAVGTAQEAEGCQGSARPCRLAVLHAPDAVILVERHEDVGALGHLLQDPLGQALVEHQEPADLTGVHHLGPGEALAADPIGQLLLLQRAPAVDHLEARRLEQ